MANIANLAVQLTAHTGSFHNRMNAARTPVQQFASSVGTASKVTRGFAGVMGLAGAAAGAAAGIGYLLKNQAEAIDRQSKFADRTGLSTREVAGFEMASKLAGVEVETLSRGVDIFIRKLGQLKAGLSEDSKAFTAMGLSADVLQEMSTGEALKVVAERIRELPSEAEQAAAAFAVFGKSGQALLPFLKEGSKGLDAFIAKADLYGQSFSALDGKNVEAANDAIEETKMALEGAARTLVIEMAPAVKQMAEDFNSWITAGDGIKSTFEGIEPVLSRLAAVTRGIVGGLERGNKLLKEANERSNGPIGAPIDKAFPLRLLGFGRLIPKDYGKKSGADLESPPVLAGASKNTGAGMIDVGAMEDMQSRAEAYRKAGLTATEEYAAKLREINELAKAGMLTPDEGGRAQMNALKEWKSAAPEWKKHEERAERVRQVVERLKTPMDKYSETAKELRRYWDEGAISAEQYNRGLEEAYAELEQTDAKMVEAKRHMDALNDAAKSTWDETRTPMEQYNERLAELNEQLEAGKISMDTFGRARQKALEDVAGGSAKDILGDLETPMEKYNARLAELQQAQGLGVISKADAGRAQGAAFEQLQRDSGAASIIEETLTPLEEYNRQIDKLNELQRQGLLTQDQWARGARAAGEEFAGAGEKIDDYWRSLEGNKFGQGSALLNAFSLGSGNSPAAQVPQQRRGITGVTMENGIAKYHGPDADKVRIVNGMAVHRDSTVSMENGIARYNAPGRNTVGMENGMAVYNAPGAGLDGDDAGYGGYPGIGDVEAQDVAAAGGENTGMQSARMARLLEQILNELRLQGRKGPAPATLG